MVRVRTLTVILIAPEFKELIMMTVIESYITHIRIIEDAAHPSSPPPPNSSQAAKKPRLIIVAVRKSGRVRMHKARENVNGTFSIGKTWMLDDLSAIQSYSGATPSTPEEERYKQWAGGIGFIVTIGKPYYWQANTQKEKQFFIASLVKIFTKYTGGKAPELLGFDTREREQLLGLAGRSALSTQAPPPSVSSSGSVPSPPYQSRPLRREPSREPMLGQNLAADSTQRGSLSNGAPSLASPISMGRPQTRARRDASPNGSLNSAGTGGLQSQTNLRRIVGMNPSQESFARSEDSTSLPPRSRGGLNGLQNTPGRFQDRSMTPTSQRAVTPDSAHSAPPDEVPPVPAPLSFPPERRRPPMPILGDPSQRNQNSFDNFVPAPLTSPGMRRDEMRLPVRNGDRSQPRTPDTERSSNGQSKIGDVSVPSYSQRSSPDLSRQLPVRSPDAQPSTVSPPVEAPLNSASEEDLRPGLGPMIKTKNPSITSPISEFPIPDIPGEEERPGLGPMIKKKKSAAEIANTFLKAAKTANSFSTFKPRVGGAAERLREAALKAQEKVLDEPDGITGVVPAPSLVRSNGSDNKIPTRNLNDGVPEVKITVPDPERPSSLDGPIKTKEDTSSSEEPKPKEAKRPKPASEIMQRELASLGIDPSFLGGRGNDLITAWEEFGWVGEGIHTKNIDQMKDEIDRELNKVQAGGWLTRLDEEDERIADIHGLIDKVINECDELDGLLTLYRVELSVGYFLPFILCYCTDIIRH